MVMESVIVFASNFNAQLKLLLFDATNVKF
jgi:hypothetical protein